MMTMMMTSDIDSSSQSLLLIRQDDLHRKSSVVSQPTIESVNNKQSPVARQPPRRRQRRKRSYHTQESVGVPPRHLRSGEIKCLTHGKLGQGPTSHHHNHPSDSRTGAPPSNLESASQGSLKLIASMAKPTTLDRPRRKSPFDPVSPAAWLSASSFHVV